MGLWITLHLFDDKLFYAQIVPTLRGEKGNFDFDYLTFMKSHITGGIAHFSDEQKEALLKDSVYKIKEIAEEFDNSFKKHRKFNQLENYRKQREFLNKYVGYYEFNSFFEYYLFKTCTDFYPHITLGKHGLHSKFNLEAQSLASSFMIQFDNWDSLFCADQMGIINWMTGEEVELLYHDRENLKSKHKDFLKSFYTLLEVAYKNSFGLIMGVDMHERRLEQLPGFKLVKKEAWNEIDTEGLLFKR